MLVHACKHMSHTHMNIHIPSVRHIPSVPYYAYNMLLGYIVDTHEIHEHVFEHKWEQ